MSIKILFLLANPTDQARLSLDREHSAVYDALRSSEYGRAFDLRTFPDVRRRKLQRILVFEQPSILHFSGHGTSRDELMFVGDGGKSETVEGRVLASMFSRLSKLRLVVLNACFSESQTSGIIESVDCAIGMSSAISDEAAISFAEELYLMLGQGMSVRDAFDAAIDQLDVEDLGEEHIPKLRHRAEVDPAAIYLTTGDADARPRAEGKVGHVDRVQEIATFRSLLSESNEAHILLLTAPGGMGKTALLGEFWRQVEDLPRAYVDFKKGTYEPVDVLEQLRLNLGAESFHRFTQQRKSAQLSSGASAQADSTERRAALRRVTGAFVEDLVDLSEAKGPMVILIDAFNSTETELAEWLQEVFLEALRRHRGIVVVVAGHVTPLIDTAFDDSCVEQSLEAFSLEDIREVARQAHISVDETIIQHIYAATQGAPLSIVTWAKTVGAGNAAP